MEAKNTGVGSLPNPGIELGSPALQVDSLPTELSGKPVFFGCKQKKDTPRPRAKEKP